MIFEDEASFRQDATIHVTWSRRGHTPIIETPSERKSIKVYGCIDIKKTEFLYQITEKTFNAINYLNFLEEVLAKRYYPKKVFYIQDNAPYHKNELVWKWFNENRSWLYVTNLPPYCPELNAAESIWKYTRKQGTHNRYFKNCKEMIMTLENVFNEIQNNPELISGYMEPFT